MLTRRIHDFLPDIKDYYTVTSEGEVYSDSYGIMKSRNCGKTEYQIINFQRIDGTKRTIKLHRLVMLAFNPIENSDEMQINHIDGNKKIIVLKILNGLQLLKIKFMLLKLVLVSLDEVQKVISQSLMRTR